MFNRCFRPVHGRCAAAVVAGMFALPTQAAPAADEFAVSAAQLQALGVRLQRLERPADIAGPAYAARVALPPRQEQIVSAPLAGVVDQVLVAENDAVQAGQPLVRLVSPELGELQLKLMEAGSRSRLSAKTLQRERQLFAEGIIPERRVQAAEADAAENQARRRQAEAALGMAGVDAATIRRVVEGGRVDTALTLRSRGAGLVTGVDARLGQRVQQADALLRVADTRRLWLDVQVPVASQAEAASAKGTPVAVVGRDVRAVVLGVGAAVSDSQTLTLRAEVTSGATSLRPGEFVQVRVPFAAGGPGFAVPIGAITRQGGTAHVFVRTAKGFVARTVTVLASAGQSVRIQADDLQAGQEIATTSVIALKAAWQGKGGSD